MIAGLGAPAWDITAAGDHPRNLPLWGGMGSAASIGLGLALAQPRRPVLVITGDGEMLMGIGTLATIAVARPPNLSIVVLDNEHYGETGMQRTHTGAGVDRRPWRAAPAFRASMRCGMRRRWRRCARRSTRPPARSSPRSRSRPTR
ncbi:thiamine pyrophosphate-dependent enzyme [Teichococcus aestuarii]|uniref:thiamine pyrophosphate-dependent enzyme n=1 Tax=Teichococcus aestuarii TaxID=568898 RepID=UPI0036225281